MDLFGQLDDLLNEIGAEIVALLAQVLNFFLAIIQFVWNVILNIAQYLVDGFKAIGGFFAHLWDSFFKGIFTSFLSAVRSLTSWLEEHLRPIIDFLKGALAYVNKLYTTYVRPILRAIQSIRRVISLLRLLHIHVFDSLDKALATVQRDINAVFTQIRGILNSAIDLLNIISDPSKLLRHPTLILSVRRSAMALIRNTTGLPPGFFIPSPGGKAQSAIVRPFNSALSPLSADVLTGALGLGPVPFNFDPNDPLQNPPASSYLQFDSGVPDFSDLGDGETIADDNIDDMAALDYFDSLFNFDDDSEGIGDQLDAITGMFLQEAAANG